jgi:3-deoxy-7-phosphoheptulonate synthase
VSRSIAELRGALDALHVEIVALLERRERLARDVVALKSGPLYSPTRESEIQKRAGVYARELESIVRNTRSRLATSWDSGDFYVVAGPCSIESAEHAMECASAIAAVGLRRMRGGCWKPRTSPGAFQGHGEVALRWMRAACDQHGLELWTEMRDVANLRYLDLVDVPWVGARNGQNYELLGALGRQAKRVMLKRGAGMTVEEWIGASGYVSAGGASVLLCERGVRGFEPMTRNTLDLAGAWLARAMSGLPVIVDVSHSTGLPELALPMVRASRAAGLDGAIVETHPRPSESVTDARQALAHDALAALATACVDSRATADVD